MYLLRFFFALLLVCFPSGCALLTTPVKVVGTAASTTVKTAGAVVSAPFKMAGDAEE